MITQHRKAQRGKVLARSYEYVIVGGGSAGCVVARRLIDGTDATVLDFVGKSSCTSIRALFA
jgi:hypothetical protein